MDTSLAMDDILEEKKEIKKVTNLRLITGGGEPPNKTGNWLKDMEPGTVFFVRATSPSKDFNLYMFQLLGKEGTNSSVICLRSPLQPKEQYVEPNRFCSQFELHHSMGVLYIPEEENKDDEVDRLPPSGVEEKKNVD